MRPSFSKMQVPSLFPSSPCSSFSWYTQSDKTDPGEQEQKEKKGSRSRECSYQISNKHHHPSTPYQPQLTRLNQTPNGPFFCIVYLGETVKSNNYNAFLNTLHFHLVSPDLLFFLLPFRFAFNPFLRLPLHPIPFGPFCPFCQSEMIALAWLCLTRWIMDGPWANRKLAQPPLFLFHYLFHNTILLPFFLLPSRIFPLCLPFLDSLQTPTHTLGKKKGEDGVSSAITRGSKKRDKQSSTYASWTNIRWVVGMKQGVGKVCERVHWHWWKRVRHEKREHPKIWTEKRNQKQRKR